MIENGFTEDNKKSFQVNRWVYIFAGILIMLLLGTVYSYSVFRVALERELKIGSFESGIPYMTALASYAISMLLSGRHIEKLNPRTVIISGGLLVSLGWILSYLARGTLVLAFTYGCISGAGVGLVYGVVMNVIAKWFPEKRGLAVGLVLVGFGLSPMITAPVGEMLVDRFGVFNAFLFLGIIFGLAITMLALPFKYPVGSETLNERLNTGSQIKPVEVPLKEMTKTRRFRGLYANFIIGTMIGLMMIGMTVNAGVEYFGLDTSTVAGLMAFFAISNGLGRPVMGWFTDRFSPRTAMMTSFSLIMAAAILLIVLHNGIIIYIGTFSILWFNLGGWLAIAPASTIRFFGARNYSENYGLVFTAYGIGAITGVTGSGILLDLHGNYLYIFLYIIILCAAGLLVTGRSIRSDI